MTTLASRTTRLLTAALALLFAGHCSQAARLVENGKSPYVIVLPDTDAPLVFPPGETLTYAAEFLRDHVEKATGARLEITRETEAPADAPKIWLGATRAARQAAGDPAQFAPEELVLKTVGRDVVVCGEVAADGLDRGTLFGVYEFLERVFGVRWYFGDDRWYRRGLGIVIPHHEVVELPELDHRERPAFQRREGGLGYYTWKPHLQRQWHAVLRFGNSTGHRNPNHSQVGWTDLYGKTHPEYFALGARGRRQINFRHKHRSYICLTDPDVLQQILRNLEDYERNGTSGLFRPDPDSTYVHFACNDGMTPETVCHCPGCKPFLRPDGPVYGTVSELYFQFVKRYARELQRRWPDRRLATLAYGYYKLPPERGDIPDNVDVVYVGPPVHYANDPSVYAEAARTLKRWSELLNHDRNRLSLWMNVVSPTNRTSWVPFMYPNVLARWLREHRNVVQGCFINGLNMHLRRSGERGIFGCIQTFPMVWIQSRLAWNPDRDVEELLGQYCGDMFGPAAATMLQFYHLIIERWEGAYRGDLDMDQIDFIHQVRYPEDVRTKFQALLEQACAETPEKSIHRDRIVFYRDRIYSRFLDENGKYLNWCNRLPTYTCLYASQPPVVDGNLADPCWRNVPKFTLARRKWGDPPDRRTEIRLLHDGQALYVAARLLKHKNTPLAKEELRIDVATRIDPVRKQHCPNIHRKWDAFREIKIGSDGQLSSLDRVSAASRAGAATSEAAAHIEAKIPFSDLAPGVDVANHRQLRIQFMRYWDVWDKWNTWSPMLSHISDYPTYRFGVLNFVGAPRDQEHTGEE